MNINVKKLSALTSAIMLSTSAMGSCNAPVFGGNYQSTDYQQAEFTQCEDVDRQQQQNVWQQQEMQQAEQQKEQRKWDKEEQKLLQVEIQDSQ